MEPKYLNDTAIEQLIARAFEEDLGDGDHSSLAAIPENLHQKAEIIAKESGVLAGVALARRVFLFKDPDLQIHILKNDGETMQIGDRLILLEGKARSILSAERLALNCMQRMSGIATLTRKTVEQLKGTHTQLLDTRKTTPNFRLAEKWAVAIGGGTNHRFGLFDMIMLKDNHIDFAGGVTQAIDAAKEYLAQTGRQLNIEVETRTLDEVRQAIEHGGADVIMLDNMDTDTMKTAVKLIAGRCKTEASGGITPDNIRQVAECGVDFVSMGSLTHAARSLDISLKAVSA